MKTKFKLLSKRDMAEKASLARANHTLRRNVEQALQDGFGLVTGTWNLTDITLRGKDIYIPEDSTYGEMCLFACLLVGREKTASTELKEVAKILSITLTQAKYIMAGFDMWNCGDKESVCPKNPWMALGWTIAHDYDASQGID